MTRRLYQTIISWPHFADGIIPHHIKEGNYYFIKSISYLLDRKEK